MDLEISVFRIKHNGHLVLRHEDFKQTYIGYSVKQARYEFLALVKRETKKNIKLSLKNIY